MSNMLFLVYMQARTIIPEFVHILYKEIYNFTGFIKINNDYHIKSMSDNVLASMQTNM
jgi:hypothetical protein